MTVDVLSNSQNFGYNIGLELTACFEKYLDLRDKELNQLINSMKMNNMKIKLIADVTNKLAHGKQKDKKIDLNTNETMAKYAYLIHLSNPTIFENKIHGVDANPSTLDQVLNEAMQRCRDRGMKDKDIHLAEVLGEIQMNHSIKFDMMNEAEMDVVIQGLDAENKMYTADLNKDLMEVNTKYDDRSQMSENAQKVLKEADEHVLSIIRKTGRGG